MGRNGIKMSVHIERKREVLQPGSELPLLMETSLLIILQ